jgi:Ca-activated chloride channel family protein
VEGHPAKSHRSPPRDPTAVARSEDLVTVRLRYQRPGAEKYWLLECPVTDSGESFAAASRDFQFTAAVAAFGMALRGSQYRGDITWEAIEKIADSARGEDPEGLREEFVELVRIARQLSPGR